MKPQNKTKLSVCYLQQTAIKDAGPVGLKTAYTALNGHILVIIWVKYINVYIFKKRIKALICTKNCYHFEENHQNCDIFLKTS